MRLSLPGSLIFLFSPTTFHNINTYITRAMSVATLFISAIASAFMFVVCLLAGIRKKSMPLIYTAIVCTLLSGILFLAGVFIVATAATKRINNKWTADHTHSSITCHSTLLF